MGGELWTAVGVRRAPLSALSCGIISLEKWISAIFWRWLSLPYGAGPRFRGSYFEPVALLVVDSVELERNL